MNLSAIHFAVDMVGLMLGVPLNILLLWIIFATARRSQIRAYSYLFIVSSSYDLFFAVAELILQHQVLIHDGIFNILAHGIENYLPCEAYQITFAIHMCSIVHAVFILAPLYHFRYLIVSRGQTAATPLIRNLIITSSTTVIIGLIIGYGVRDALQLPKEYYLEMFPKDSLLAEDFDEYFIYAFDIRCPYISLGYGMAFTGYGISYAVAFYYGFCSWSHIRSYSHEMSPKTRSLQMQFTRGLMVQTCSALVLSVLPGLACSAFLLRANIPWMGALIMTPLSWAPAVNALLTMQAVKSFRVFLLEMLNRWTGAIMGASEISVTSSVVKISYSPQIVK